jgi:hypothetical protein
MHNFCIYRHKSIHIGPSNFSGNNYNMSRGIFYRYVLLEFVIFYIWYSNFAIINDIVHLK